MANGAKPPGTGAPRQVQFKINLNELPTKGCPICRCSVFNTNVGLFKQISALQSPTGKGTLARVELASCIDCGTVVQVVKDELKLVEMVPKETPSET